MRNIAICTLIALSTLLGAGTARAERVETSLKASPLAFVEATKAKPRLEGTINLNTATEKELELLPGVGPSTARKIVAYRAKHPFKDTLHVMRIKGIGRKTYNEMKPYLALKGETTLRKVK